MFSNSPEIGFLGLILPPLTSPITVTMPSLAQTYILYCDSSLSSTDPWISLKANLYNAESSTAWTLTLYILIHSFFANSWVIISRNIHQWQWRSINLLNGTLKKVGSVVVWRCMIIGKICFNFQVMLHSFCCTRYVTRTDTLVTIQSQNPDGTFSTVPVSCTRASPQCVLIRKYAENSLFSPWYFVRCLQHRSSW